MVAKVSGLLQIREDTTPSKLIWKAIDQDKMLEVPLNNLSKLQASPDASPKMLLRLFYIQSDVGEIKDIKLTFNNRQTMNSVKETLQTIVARQKTVIKDTPVPARNSPMGRSSSTATPDPSAGSNQPEGSKKDPLDFSSPESLSDASLLKNRQLQQKLLLEDKVLRNIFTQSVINYKLSPSIFWSTRVSQLRTYALGTCQHRGPYNVLSTIKPVATSDNQVNVNVTRDTINEIFDTYPIIRRACDELVPDKLNEGEFWSRFFNSKLFRRLRGDKINNTSTRGDIVIDKYLYVDNENAQKEGKSKSPSPPQQHRVNKFIDLYGNEADNSQKLGISPDFTMKFSHNEKEKDLGEVDGDGESGPNTRENEMLILMKNMNKLSSKMIGYSSELPSSREQPIEDMEKELEIADLNETSDIQYIELHLESDIGKHSTQDGNNLEDVAAPYDKQALKSFIESSTKDISVGTFDLKDTFENKSDEISKAAQDITGLVKHNFRVYKLMHSLKEPNIATSLDLIPEAKVQELIAFNVTLIEFLLHFWNLFLSGGNPVQLKKIFLALKNSQTVLSTLQKDIKELIEASAKGNERLSEKLLKDLETCLFPLHASLTKALSEYIEAARAANAEQNNHFNENGKRPHEEA